MGINKAILLGHVGRPPLISDPNGKKVAKLIVGTKTYRKGEMVTDWHYVDAFEKNAEFIDKYVEKGDLVAIDGYLHSSKYKNKYGYDMFNYSVRINTIELLKKSRYAKKEKLEDIELIDDDVKSSEDAPY